jgi:hypothetical protein
MNRRTLLRLISALPFVGPISYLPAQAQDTSVPTWQQVNELVQRESRRGYDRATLMADRKSWDKFLKTVPPSIRIYSDRVKIRTPDLKVAAIADSFILETYSGPNSNEWTYNGAGNWDLHVWEPQTRF